MPSFPAFVIAFMWVLGLEFYFPPMVWENKEFDFRSDLSFLMFVALFKTLEGFFFHTLVQDLCRGPRRSQISAKGFAGACHCAQYHFILSPIHVTHFPLFVLHPLHLFSDVWLLLFNRKPTQPERMNTMSLPRHLHLGPHPS